MAEQERDLKEILAQMKGRFENGVAQPIYREWLKEAVWAFGFYDGILELHWDSAELKDLRKRKVEPQVINKTAARLDNVAGAEIQTRTKVIYRARSLDKKERATAEALTDLAMFVQEKNNSTHILSRVSDDSRKCGLGWHEFDVQGSVIREQARNPLEVVPDFRDRSPDMSNQRILSTMNWMPRAEVQAKFPDKAKDVEDATSWAPSATIPPLENDPLRFTACGGYQDKPNDELLVIEQMWAEPMPYYEVITPSKRLVTTFDHDEAIKLAGGEEAAKDNVTKKDGFKVFVGYFTGDILLDFNEDFYQLDPTRGTLLLRPLVCKRERASGRPYGLMRAAKDPQRSYNKNRTRLRWLQAAHQVIMEGNAADQRSAREEAAKPDGVILVRPGKRLDINRHEAAIAQHLSVLQQDDKDIQDALGIYDESLGIETNANSGIAIQKRQAGTNRNQAQITDNLTAMKREWGMTLLRLVQSVFTEEVAFWVTDDAEGVRALVLNEPELDAAGQPVKDKTGQPVVKFDIRTGVYDVYVEEIPDVATQTEFARELVLKAVQSAGMEGITPGLLELLGVPKSAKLMEELNADMPQRLAAGDAALAAQQSLGNGQVPVTGAPTTGAPMVGDSRAVTTMGQA